MRLARKLFLLAAMAATALALTATSASAQVTVSPEVPTGDCGDVTLGASHVVSGGCHVQFTSTGNGIPLHAYIPAKTTISNCTVDLEGFLGSDGEGYVTEMGLTAPSGGPVPCTRTACDEADGTKTPWPVHIVEHGPGNEEIEAVFCLRPVANPVGSQGTPCEIHLELTEPNDHEYELGHSDADNGTEVECENSPPNGTSHPTLPFDITIEPHLVTSGTERVEINH